MIDTQLYRYYAFYFESSPPIANTQLPNNCIIVKLLSVLQIKIGYIRMISLECYFTLYLEVLMLTNNFVAD